MNVFYTAGWIIEAFLYKAHSEAEDSLGPRLLRFGLSLSCFIAAFPAIFWVGYWLLHVVGLIK